MAKNIQRRMLNGDEPILRRRTHSYATSVDHAIAPRYDDWNTIAAEGARAWTTVRAQVSRYIMRPSDIETVITTMLVCLMMLRGWIFIPFIIGSILILALLAGCMSAEKYPWGARIFNAGVQIFNGCMRFVRFVEGHHVHPGQLATGQLATGQLAEVKTQ